MQWRNLDHRYGLIARSNHWLSAVLIVGLGASGWWMSGLDYYHPWYYRAPELHKQFGVLALLLAALRLLALLVDRPPALPDTLSRTERRLARGVHAMLYLLMLAVPLSGYIMVTAAGDPVDVLGLALPPIGAGEPDLRDAAIAVHAWGAWSLLALAAGHAAAALKHRLVDRDEVLSRML